MSDVSQLTAMFPDIEQEVLSAMLAHHGSVDRVVEALLDESTGDSTEIVDVANEDMARQVQELMDQEIAQALQQELNAERQSAAGSPSPLVTLAAVKVAAVAGGTKRLFQPLLQRACRTTTQEGQSKRLIDEASVNEPLASPLYTPFASQEYVAPSVPVMTQEASSTHARAEDSPTVVEASTSLAATMTPQTSRYASRVERARLANRTSSASACLSTASSKHPMPSTLPPLVAPPAVASPGIAVGDELI
eukprot:CAMPEP_0174725378 /NCGR_PEP_ID=MMETSP1094-20130205/45403_1 /TAXON_ID=156173 /ORGANISM="Chrysochromulina brevifilum, Strain UTEX LB 985" /LENGTH=248 /DNA_ID=CAMNT_0015926765 /DNA_START=70 /DNA_END=816 /DNA_ORIENTATION=-